DVYPKAEIAPRSDVFVCNGEVSGGITLVSTNVPTATIKWSIDNGSIGLSPSSGTGNVGSFTAINTGSLPIEAIVTAISYVDDCPGDTLKVKITVNPTPKIDPINDISVCNNTDTPLINFIGVPAATDFIWNSDITLPNLGNSGSGDSIPSFKAINNAETSIVANITVKSKAKGCPGADVNFTITVKPTPVVAKPDDQELCNGELSNPVVFESLTPNTVFDWTNSNVAIGLSTLADNKDIPSFTATNLGSTPIVSTITVKPTAESCPGLPKTFTITVNPSPKATVTGGAVVCKDATSPKLVFKGSNGKSPYKITYNINGNSDISVFTEAGDSVQVVVPTNEAGIFTYNLLSVTDASTTSCNSVQTGTAVFTVNAPPTATISGDATVCLGEVQPLITFTGAVGLAPYTFTYQVNSGANQTVTTTSGNNSVTVPVNTTVAGTFSYQLISVSDANVSSCSQNQTGIAAVTVNPKPEATISGATQVCVNSTEPLVTFTGSGGAAPYTFEYTENGVAKVITTTSGNSVTVAVSTSTAEKYSFVLNKVTDNSSTQCNNLVSGNVDVIVSPAPKATITGNAEVCLNTTSPVITFTGSEGTAPYTFNYTIDGIATSTTSQTNILQLPVSTSIAGTSTYILTSVTDAATFSCSLPVSGSAIVTVNPAPSATISGDKTVCMNETNLPVVTFKASGGVLPYTFNYTLNNVPASVTASSSSETTVTVSTTNSGSNVFVLTGVTDASLTQCTIPVSGTVTVNVSPAPIASIAGGGSVCLNAASPVVEINGSNSTAPYTFTYTENSETKTITSVGDKAIINVPTNAAGTLIYTLVEVADASGLACKMPASGNAVINVNPLPTASISGTASVCIGGLSPQITFTGSGGTKPYTFTYKDTLGVVKTITSVGVSDQASVSIATSKAGTYSVELMSVSDASCSNNASGTASVTVGTAPTATIAYGTYCKSVSDPQSVVLTGSIGGTFSALPAGLSIDPTTGAINPSLSSIGNYVVTYTTPVSGACPSVSTTANVSIQDKPTISVNSGTVCLGSSIALTASGCTNGTLAWSNSILTSPTIVVSPVVNSNFSVTCTDNACTSEPANGIVVVSSTPIPNVSPNTASCGDLTGGLTINSPTGVGYEYSVDNGTTFASNNVFTGLSFGTTYNIIVKNDIGCKSGVQTASITGKAAVAKPILAVTQPNCNNTLGKIEVKSPLGLQYQIDNQTAQTTTIFDNLPAKIYTIKVTNADGCFNDETTTIDLVEKVPALSTSVVQPDCINGNGKITVNTPVGAGYEYRLNGNGTYQPSNVFENLAPNSYTVEVRNATNCTNTKAETIFAQPNGVGPLNATVDPITCKQPKAIITIGNIGLNYSYSYTKLDDNTTLSQASNVFANLSYGNYKIEVTNGNGCKRDTTIEVLRKEPVEEPVNKLTQPTCDNALGKIEVLSPSGVEYSIDTAPTVFTSNPEFGNLIPGTYTITARNTYGCTAERKDIILPQPNGVVIPTPVVVQPTCSVPTGSITIPQPLVGSGFEYSKDDGSTFQTTGVFTGLAASEYKFVVKNGAGCKATTTVTLLPKVPVSAIATTVTPATCTEGTSTIEITAPISSGITYSIFPTDSSSFSGKLAYDKLTAGTYILIAKNADGCTSRKVEQMLAAPNVVTLDAPVLEDATCSTPTGKVTINVKSGSGTGFTYSKDGGATTQPSNEFANLPAGDYT
ncbi:MAG: hypothetical protein KA313_05960, partial [Pseudarcicella sp.]|nr:hypothetical protein [Pseudarcicella sp.]